MRESSLEVDDSTAREASRNQSQMRRPRRHAELHRSEQMTMPRPGAPVRPTRWGIIQERCYPTGTALEPLDPVDAP